MPRVLFKGAALSKSELCHIVKGNYYFCRTLSSSVFFSPVIRVPHAA
jgi:hypothetical protein